jgi:microcystin-dependent protein
MANPFLAEIRIFPFNFAPTGWAMCNGQLLPISQNTALFSLLGTYYGGDGVSTFALPNLLGSTPLQQGQGPGLTDYVLGEQTGSPTISLIESEIPTHQHFFMATSNPGTVESAPDNQLGVGASGSKTQNYFANLYSPNAASATTQMSPLAIGITGQSLPHDNMMPYLTLNFCIALQGIYPARP